MLEKLTMADFSRHLNHTFRIWLESKEDSASVAQIEAELIEVTELGAPRDEKEERTSFSIIFRGPSEPVLPQQVYSLEHKGLDRLDLFLVPLGLDQGGMLYEAVFT